MLVRWAADNRLGYSSGLIKTSQKEGISFLSAVSLFELLKKEDAERFLLCSKIDCQRCRYVVIKTCYQQHSNFSKHAIGANTHFKLEQYSPSWMLQLSHLFSRSKK